MASKKTTTKKRFKLSDEERKEQNADMRQRTQAAAEALLGSEGWQKWVRTRAKFTRYSLRNQLLIAMQMPTATRVAGYGDWRKNFNRQVLKGQKSIWIFGRPFVKPLTDRVTGEPKLDRNGRPITIRRFPICKVFDYSQTEQATDKDGVELPLIDINPPGESIEGDSHAHLIPLLEAHACELGLTVVYEPIAGDTEGYHSPVENKIGIDPRASKNALVRVLVHELVHAHGLGYKEYSRDECEVMVDCATLIACDALGLDVSASSVPYIAGWGEKGGLKALERYASIIDTIALRLEKACDPTITRSEKLVELDAADDESADERHALAA